MLGFCKTSQNQRPMSRTIYGIACFVIYCLISEPSITKMEWCNFRTRTLEVRWSAHSRSRQQHSRLSFSCSSYHQQQHRHFIYHSKNRRLWTDSKWKTNIFFSSNLARFIIYLSQVFGRVFLGYTGSIKSILTCHRKTNHWSVSKKKEKFSTWEVL